MESFSQFWKLLFYKVSRKIPENLPKIFICKISQRGTWESSRGPTMPPHLGQARPSPGRAQAWCGPPGPPLIPFPLSLFLSPQKHQPFLSNTSSCCYFSRISISLLSPSFLLKFGAFDLWYVTPPYIQVEFCLVKYFLSILLQ